MNPFSVLTSKIYGGLSVVLIAALVWLYVSTSATIASYEKAINHPVTGWKTVHTACMGNLATARGNALTLGAQIDRQNDAFDALVAATAARRAAGAAERAEAGKAVARAQAQVTKLEKAEAGADVCTSADALILENVK